MPFLIGVTLDVGGAGGSCISEQVTKRKMIDGTRFDPGDYAISVKWRVRLDEDCEQVKD